MEERVERAIKNLNQHNFQAGFFSKPEEAIEVILERIPASARVGIPGSKTIRQLGLDRALKERGQITYDHWQEGLSPQEILEIRRAQLACDILLTSANAITETGEIYNVDGIGNRIAPMIFGAGRVMIVAGVNKLVPDLEQARVRLKKISAPKRASELGLDLPCARTGECTDCNSPLRICRAELVLYRPPGLTPIEVYLIDRELGN